MKGLPDDAPLPLEFYELLADVNCRIEYLLYIRRDKLAK